MVSFGGDRGHLIYRVVLGGRVRVRRFASPGNFGNLC